MSRRIFVLTDERLTRSKSITIEQAADALINWYQSEADAISVLNSVESGAVFSVKEDEHDWQPETLLSIIDID